MIDAVTAHGLLCLVDEADRPELPVEGEAGELDTWPACATALAVLSGDLEHVEDVGGVLLAVESGATLLRAGVVTAEDMQRAAGDVVLQVIAFGARAEAEANHRWN